MAKNLLKKVNEDGETTSDKVFWAIMYLVLIIVVLVSSCFIFNRTYYSTFVVDGESMKPTFNNDIPQGYYEYGIVDEHKMVFNSLERNDIVITYYRGDLIEEPGKKPVVIKDQNGKPKDAKIKRLIGMPYEKVTIYSLVNAETKKAYNQITITPLDKNMKEMKDDKGNIIENVLAQPFEVIDPDGLNKALAYYGTEKSHSWNLGKDQYFVMGDNWGNSLDSTDPSVGIIEKDYLSGLVISLQGYCKKNENGKLYDKTKYPKERVFK